MDRLEKMLRFEKIAHPVKRVIVDENRSEERLFRLDIVRRGTITRGGFLRGFTCDGFDGHDVPVFF